MISIITPVYNGVEFLPATIQSVLAQTTGDWEWLLVDDGSLDGTLDLCANAACRDSRIRVLRHPNGANLGQGVSRNLAIRHASGEFLAFLDCDDLWIPEKLERDVATFARHPTAVLLYSRLLYWYDWRNSPETGTRNRTAILGVACDKVLQAPELLLHVLQNLDFAYQFPAPSCVAIRRSSLPAGGELFDPNVRQNFEDVVPITKLLLHHPAVVCEDLRMFHRRHPGSESAGLNPAKFDADFHRIVRWIDSYVASNATPSMRGAVERALGRAIQRRRISKTKARVIAGGRKVLPARFRKWLWKKYDKRWLL